MQIQLAAYTQQQRQAIKQTLLYEYSALLRSMENCVLSLQVSRINVIVAYMYRLLYLLKHVLKSIFQ